MCLQSPIWPKMAPPAETPVALEALGSLVKAKRGPCMRSLACTRRKLGMHGSRSRPADDRSDRPGAQASGPKRPKQGPSRLMASLSDDQNDHDGACAVENRSLSCRNYNILNVG